MRKFTEKKKKRQANMFEIYQGHPRRSDNFQERGLATFQEVDL